jgi:membrane protein implicated in regulation of membrane protease activity
MGVVFLIIAAIVVMSGVFGVSMHITNPFSMVVAIVAIAIFSGVIREALKNRRERSKMDQTEMTEIKQRMTRMEADIADIKEQIADILIKQI